MNFFYQILDPLGLDLRYYIVRSKHLLSHELKNDFKMKKGHSVSFEGLHQNI